MAYTTGTLEFSPINPDVIQPDTTKYNQPMFTNSDNQHMFDNGPSNKTDDFVDKVEFILNGIPDDYIDDGDRKLQDYYEPMFTMDHTLYRGSLLQYKYNLNNIKIPEMTLYG